MSTHAVLVVTFGDADVHARLVELLDDPDIDFYVHVDRRTSIEPYRTIGADVRYSTYHLAPRRRAPNWGSHRFVRVQLDLLTQAAEVGYDRYHLVSGSDLPLVDAVGLKRFFDEHPRHQYVGFADRNLPGRLDVYYPLQSWIHKGTSSGRLLAAVQHRLVRWQRRAGVNRLRRFGPTKKGSTWYSITHEFACFALANQGFIRSLTRFALVADEAWPQTLLERSPFATDRDPARAHRPDDEQALRLIDWTRSSGSSPHVWEDVDLPHVLESDCIFARKFDAANTTLLDALVSGVRGRERPATTDASASHSAPETDGVQ